MAEFLDTKRAERQQDQRQTLPWPALVAVAIAMVCLWFSLGESFLLPVLAFALVATYFIPWRITARWLAWLIGLAATGLIVGVSWPNLGQNSGYVIDAAGLEMAALISLAMLVLGCWIRQSDRGSLGIAIFLSGFAFLLGCTTWNDSFIRFAAPAYIFFAVLSFPGFRGALAGGNEGRAAAMALRGLAVVVAVLAGAAVYGGVWTYRSQLTELGDRFLENKRVPEQAGVSVNPVLGDSFGLQGSPARVLIIDGPLGDSHLRGLTFDTYYMGAWQGGLYSGPVVNATPESLGSSATGPRAEVTCLADSAGIVYTTLNTSGIDLQTGDAPSLWAPQSGAAIRTKAAPPYQYAIIAGRTPFQQGPLCVPPDSHGLARDLAIPQGLDPGVGKLAHRIGGNLFTPQDKILAVVGYLQGHYSYSLTIHPGPGDPVSNFLLHKKAAYCEYFASAAVILLRYLGVPSRYVVGYYAHESDGPDRTVVRQWDSHAWAEAWVDGVGWVTVDATPGDGLPDQLDHTVPFWTRAWEWLQDHAANWRAELAKLGPAAIAGIVAGIALAILGIRLLVALVLGAWYRRRSQKQALFGYTGPDREMREIARRFEALLARSGLDCPGDVPWRERLQSAGQSEESPAGIDTDAALAFIEEYNAARFGSSDHDAALSLREKLQRLEEARR